MLHTETAARTASRRGSRSRCDERRWCRGERGSTRDASVAVPPRAAISHFAAAAPKARPQPSRPPSARAASRRAISGGCCVGSSRRAFAWQRMRRPLSPSCAAPACFMLRPRVLRKQAKRREGQVAALQGTPAQVMLRRGQREGAGRRRAASARRASRDTRLDSSLLPSCGTVCATNGRMASMHQQQRQHDQRRAGRCCAAAICGADQRVESRLRFCRAVVLCAAPCCAVLQASAAGAGVSKAGLTPAITHHSRTRGARRGAATCVLICRSSHLTDRRASCALDVPAGAGSVQVLHAGAVAPLRAVERESARHAGAAGGRYHALQRCADSAGGTADEPAVCDPSEHPPRRRA